METNKLTIEEQFLTLEQAKELQELGVDIYGNFEIDIDDNGFETIEKVGTFASDTFEYYVQSNPTLSVAEMIEMLPKEIIDGRLIINYFIDKYSVTYMDCDGLTHHSKGGYLLRDALFEMLKWLKQNKFI